jgi:hypothetical protein
MKFRLGPVPRDPTFQPEQGGWRRLREPSFGLLIALAIPTSLLAGAAVLFAWMLLVRIHGVDAPVEVVVSPWSLLGALAAVFGLVVAHELAHAVFLPRCGLTPATTLGFWLQTVTPYVSYRGELARDRYFLVTLMPFLLLSAAPLFVALLTGWIPLGLVLLTVVNAALSSGDLITAALLLAQTPRSAVVRHQGLETWWRV